MCMHATREIVDLGWVWREKCKFGGNDEREREMHWSGGLFQMDDMKYGLTLLGN